MENLISIANKTDRFVQDLERSNSDDIDAAVVAWTVMIPKMMALGYERADLVRMLNDHVSVQEGAAQVMN